jgi:hypothetical protein
MRSDLLTRTAPASSSLAYGQVRTPGDDLHVERERGAGETRPEATKTHNTEGLAGEAHAAGRAKLEAAGAHNLVGDGNCASGGDHQAKCEFSGRVEGVAARRVADRHALTRAGLDIDRRI